MGSPKALLRLSGRTFLGRAAAALRGGGVERTVAVVAAGAPRVQDEAEAAASSVVVNHAPDRGMLSSLLLGLDAAEAMGADAVLIHPVDHPLVAVETVQRVVQALHAGARIAVPSHEGRRGHPGGFARGAWDALRGAPAEEGARAVLTAHPEWITHVVGDPGCVRGVNTPGEYARLCDEFG